MKKEPPRQRETIIEHAYRLGVNVDTLKRWAERKKVKVKGEEAKRQLLQHDLSAGWNPQAGSKGAK